MNCCEYHRDYPDSSYTCARPCKDCDLTAAPGWCGRCDGEGCPMCNETGMCDCVDGWVELEPAS